jgi:phytoene dehydrogenase-like protein
LSEAIVVGSGPNGLACAVELARNGIEVTVLEAAERIGGGTRTSELTVPGLLHDDCSATHPMAVGSAFLRSLALERHGLEWLWPEVDLAHPLDDGSAAVMVRSIDETARGLGEDGPAWRRVFGSGSANFEDVLEEIMKPVLHVPRHPVRLVRFGLAAATPATLLARSWKTAQGRALFGGVSAHAFSLMNRPMSSSVGCALISACHAFGWPVARGGSQSISEALASVLREYGGTIETGRRVSDMSELGGADAVVFDLAPGAVAEIAGERLPGRVSRAYRRYRHGPGAFKLDLAVEGGVPWTNEACRRAGTVHAIGPFEEIVVAERATNRGSMPQRPYVLVGQQYLADPSRSEGDLHPLWAYAHVPSGYAGDASEAILGQIERFAPGFRERIVASNVRDPADLVKCNPNYVGGDIITGANTPRQLLFRPRVALDPYSCGTPGLYICSAATPPGAGAHGIGGYNAARSALRHLGHSDRVRSEPAQ